MNWLRVIGFVLVIASTARGQGYLVERDRLSIGEHHWQEWRFPQGTLSFDAEGVRPLFIRDQVNAALDADEFTYRNGVQGGVRRAGSNLGDAANIIDGQEGKVWRPDPNAPVEDWWVEIDLGRVVWVRKVVVRFVEEGDGDPFLQFKLLTSSGLAAFLQSESFDYTLAGRTEGPNKTQRVFEFDLRPTVAADAEFSGDLIQFLQIVATDSDRGQAQEVSESRWHSLSKSERGDIVYFRREPSGNMRQVDQAEYEAISDSERRGSIRYFRRERPGLTEVEVWAGGENISLGALDRGGQIVGYGNLGSEILTVDGDYTTFWAAEVGFGLSGNFSVDFQSPNREVFFDLGTWYWVNRALLVFDKLASGGAFPNYVVNLSDGSRAPDGSLIYIPLNSRGDGGWGPDRFLFYQDNPFALTRARYFKMDYQLVNSSVRSGIREIQLYGRGFLPQATLTSDLIELGRNPRVLSTIHWEADTPPGTEVQIRTRTGDRTAEDIHYFTNTGVEVTEEKYRKLLSFQRGDSTLTIIPGEDWSPWSQFYPASGAAITSPSPRRYAMIQATMLSDRPDQAASLQNLHIELDTPLASQVVGELAPGRVQQRGQLETLTLYVHPTFRSGDRGFNQVLVQLPPGVKVELMEVVIGSERDLEAGTGEVYGLDQLERVDSGPDSLWVALPVMVDQSAPELVALRFAGVLYLASNTFVSLVGLDEGGEVVWQRVDAGEVTSLGESRGMTVFTPFEGGVLGDVEVAPNPFTPNGDGVNDAAIFTFPVFKVQGAKALVLEVYRLDGHRVQRVEQPRARAVGLQQVAWDGRGQDGALLPPGLYLCRVGLEVDAEGEQPMVAKVVASVY